MLSWLQGELAHCSWLLVVSMLSRLLVVSMLSCVCLLTGKIFLCVCMCVFIEIQCSELVAPAGGVVTVMERSVGSLAEYSCPAGLTLTGSHQRTCLQNGNWSGSDPTCDGESHAGGRFFCCCCCFVKFRQLLLLLSLKLSLLLFLSLVHSSSYIHD